MDLPKVSIIIPTYNQERFILDTITSALSQTYSNLEIIVGDDCSTDNSSKLIQSINDSRLTYVRNKTNLGRVQNYKNLLYQYATGEYILNLDGDDYLIYDNFISDAIQLFDDDVVIVAANILKEYENKNKRVRYSFPSVDCLTGVELLMRLPDKKFFFKHLSTIYRRKIATEINFYSFNSLSSDWESLYRLAVHGKVKFLNKNVAVWRIHSNNQSKIPNIHSFVDNLQIWNNIFDYATVYNFPKYLSHELACKCQFYFINIYIFENIAKNYQLKPRQVLPAYLIKKVRNKYDFPIMRIIFRFPILGLQFITLSFISYFLSWIRSIVNAFQLRS